MAPKQPNKTPETGSKKAPIVVKIPGVSFQIDSDQPPHTVTYATDGSIKVKKEDKEGKITLYCFFDLSGHLKTALHYVDKLQLRWMRENNSVAWTLRREKGDSTDLKDSTLTGDTYTYSFGEKKGPKDEIIAVSVDVTGRGEFTIQSLTLTVSPSATSLTSFSKNVLKWTKPIG